MTSRLPTLMIPGLLCTPRLFEAQLTLFWQHGPVMVADTGTERDIVAQARLILADAPPVFRLLGLSMGGYLAFEILRQAPERVQELILLDTSARSDTPEGRDNRLRMIQLAEQGAFDRLAAMLYPNLVDVSRETDMVLEAIVTGMADDVGAAAYVNQQHIILSRPDSRPDLPDIRCRTLVVVGAGDRLTPPEIAAEMAEAIPDADMVIIDDCGHLSPLEQPKKLNRLLAQWLAAEGPFQAAGR
ncbi:MAG: alpha/beta hydrolase [Lautropia sp.]|nr:alpha/beta hydrolase [Lautropia sp.]